MNNEFVSSFIHESNDQWINRWFDKFMNHLSNSHIVSLTIHPYTSLGMRPFITSYTDRTLSPLGLHRFLFSQINWTANEIADLFAIIIFRFALSSWVAVSDSCDRITQRRRCITYRVRRPLLNSVGSGLYYCIGQFPGVIVFEVCYVIRFYSQWW